MPEDPVLYEQRGRVALLTLNRPERLNAWNAAMLGALHAGVDRACADPSVGAIVVTGAGRAFCAGADIGSFRDALNGEGRSGSGAAADGPGNWVTYCQSVEKPLIAAINGAAVGIGITLVLPFDIRIASENARIGMFFVRMGLVPELASSYFLAQLVGTGRAAEWCLTGRMIEAGEAREAGLVTEVTTPDALVPRALAIGELVASQPPTSIARIKQLLAENAVEHDVLEVMRRENAALADLRSTWEHKEAVTAFFEKRPPNFKRA